MGSTASVKVPDEAMKKLEEIDMALRSRSLKVPEGTASSLIREGRDHEPKRRSGA